MRWLSLPWRRQRRTVLPSSATAPTREMTVVHYEVDALIAHSQAHDWVSSDTGLLVAIRSGLERLPAATRPDLDAAGQANRRKHLS